MMGEEGYVIGVDSGSTYTKGVVMHVDGRIVATDITMTGIRILESANRLYHALLEKTGLSESDIAYVVGTGYGRYQITFGHMQVTEISAHGLAAHYLFPRTHTVLDMGGQDTKAIRINDKGEVIDFTMNDKCAAGTGRFIEAAARALGLDLRQASEIALNAKRPVKITSTCTVFAETEVLEHLAAGERLEDILYGAYLGIATRSVGLLRRVGVEPEVTFQGGVSLNKGMVKAVEELLHMKVNTSPLTMYGGAIGAALYGIKRLTGKEEIVMPTAARAPREVESA
jgi:predicted CoA-substrate-specific enzyme activase